jgi:hypothetical protein
MLSPLKPELKTTLKSYLGEVIIYAGLVAGYYFLVLHFLGGWLNGLFKHDRRLYAAIALGLIIGQGFLLEILTRLLLSLFKSSREER